MGMGTRKVFGLHGSRLGKNGVKFISGLARRTEFAGILIKMLRKIIEKFTRPVF